MTKFLSAAALCSLMFALAISTSCKHTGTDDTTANDTVYTSYRNYVVAARDTNTPYYNRSWDELNRDYEARRSAVERNANNMSAETKAEYEKSQRDWADFKARYERRHAVATTTATGDLHSTALRTALLLRPEDTKFDYLRGPDMLAAYQKFIDGVKAGKASYTTEDWNEVNTIYNSLKARREEVMNEIPSRDKMKIQNLELSYDGMMLAGKTLNNDKEKK